MLQALPRTAELTLQRPGTTPERFKARVTPRDKRQRRKTSGGFSRRWQWANHHAATIWACGQRPKSFESRGCRPETWVPRCYLASVDRRRPSSVILPEKPNHLQAVIERMMALGWILKTVARDNPGGNSPGAIVLTPEGKVRLLAAPMPDLIREIEANSGPLSEEEKKVLVGFPALAKFSAHRPPDNRGSRRV